MNFIRKIFPLLFLIISILLLIYSFYRSEIFWDGQNRDYYKIYYLISSILIFFSIVVFFLNDKKKEYLIISSLSLLTSLYLFEGYLTFKEQTKIKFNREKILNLYKELKKENNKVTISFHSSFLVDKNYSTFPFPLAGQSNTKTIHCNENGYYSIYQSDRYGFNNPDNEWDEKEVDYFLIGDSYTHGACVNRPHDISSVLRKISNKSVLNLGIGGNGSLLQYATLREYLNINVKKVLWIFYEGNDLTDLNKEIKNKFLLKYLNDPNFTQNLKKKQNDIDNFVSNIVNESVIEIKRERDKRNTFKSKLIKYIKFYNTRQLIIPKNVPISEFEKIIKLAKEFTNKNNSKLYFVYLPSISRYKKAPNNKYYNLTKKIVTELEIPFLNISQEVFEKEQNPLTLFASEHGGHYSIDGYKKIAEAIFKFAKD